MSTAVAKPAPKKGSVKAKPPAVPKRTSTSGALDDLSALAFANKEMEDAERAKSGSQNSFITLVKANSKAVDKNHPSYIKGLKPLEYAVVSKRLRLGAELDATIIGMFKLYAQTAKKESEKEMPKTIGFWMPDDAVQFPSMPGSPFTRQLPDGSILEPVHWVFVYLHDFHDIEDGMITFRSVGNGVYSDLQKLVKAESRAVTELRFKISSQDRYNKSFDKTDYYPKFEITGRNYKFQDGRVIKDKSIETGILKEILLRSKKVHEDYMQMRLVTKRNVEALAGPAARAALPAGEGGADCGEDEDEDEAVNF